MVLPWWATPGPSRPVQGYLLASPARCSSRTSAPLGGDPHGRRPIESAAVGVERRPVNRLIALATRPRRVATAVTEAGLMAHQHLARAKTVAVRASARRLGDPRPGRRLHQLAQHILKPTTEHPAAAAGLGPPNSNTGSSVLVCIGRHRMISSRAEFAYRRPGYHLGVMPAVGDLVRSGRPSVARLLSSPGAT